MSAETLRRAAALIREDWDGEGYGERSDFMLAVASRLSMSADHALGRGAVCESCVDQDIAVARAYLGESA